MILKIIIEGLILGALLWLYCTIGIRNGAVGMVFLYHKDVQDRCVQLGLIAEEKIKQNQRIFKILGISSYFVYLIICVYIINGASTV